MCIRDLSDMNSFIPWALDFEHTYQANPQIPHVHVTTIAYPPYSISTLVIQFIQHIIHNCLLVWTAWNVVSINNDGYHVMSTSIDSK